jgi:hypothetical protein
MIQNKTRTVTLMLKVLCFSECPLVFLAKKWELEENSPEFATKLMEDFVAFSKCKTTKETRHFIRKSKPDDSREKRTVCMGSILPHAVNTKFTCQKTEKSSWGDEVKCVLKIANNSKIEINALKKMFKEIIVREVHSNT